MRSLILLTFLFVQLCMQAQEKVYLPFFASENVSRQMAISATFILSDFINEGSAFEAIPAEKRDTLNFEESTSEIKESAELLSTSYYTLGSIIRMGNKYHVSLKLYTTSSSLLIWDANGLADSRDDIPVVLRYLAGNLGVKKKFSQPGDLYALSSSEAARTTRIRSNKSIGFISGAMVPLSEDQINNINGGFGLVGSFDTRSYILQLTAEVYYGNDSAPSPSSPSPYYSLEFKNRYFNLGANVLYPLSETNNTPFVGLGSAFTYRETNVKEVSPGPGGRGNTFREYDVFDTGLFLSGGGGYLLKRNSDASLFIYGRGYIYMPAVDQMVYGVMFNLALTVGW